MQKVNTYVFTNPVQVMENISLVTEFIRSKIKSTGVSAKRNVLHYSKTQAGEYYTFLQDGSFWRCCRYIDDSVSYTQTDDLKIIEESGKAFGKFQVYLADFPVEKLHIVIPHFHNTVNRYKLFREAIKENAAGRLDEVKEVIDGYLELEELATTPYALAAENGLTEELFEGQLLQLPPPAQIYTVQAGDTKTLVCGNEENYRNKNGTDVFYPGMRILL